MPRSQARLFYVFLLASPLIYFAAAGGPCKPSTTTDNAFDCASKCKLDTIRGAQLCSPLVESLDDLKGCREGCVPVDPAVIAANKEAMAPAENSINCDDVDALFAAARADQRPFFCGDLQDGYRCERCGGPYLCRWHNWGDTPKRKIERTIGPLRFDLQPHGPQGRAAPNRAKNWNSHDGGICKCMDTSRFDAERKCYNDQEDLATARAMGVRIRASNTASHKCSAGSKRQLCKAGFGHEVQCSAPSRLASSRNTSVSVSLRGDVGLNSDITDDDSDLTCAKCSSPWTDKANCDDFCAIVESGQTAPMGDYARRKMAGFCETANEDRDVFEEKKVEKMDKYAALLTEWVSSAASAAVSAVASGHREGDNAVGDRREAEGAAGTSENLRRNAPTRKRRRKRGRKNKM